jgi:hypothetical protein
MKTPGTTRARSPGPSRSFVRIASIKKVEMLFAHLKRHLRFERLRLRALTGARDELLLAATVHNLRRLAKMSQLGMDGGAMSAA